MPRLAGFATFDSAAFFSAGFLTLALFELLASDFTGGGLFVFAFVPLDFAACFFAPAFGVVFLLDLAVFVFDVIFLPLDEDLDLGPVFRFGLVATLDASD